MAAGGESEWKIRCDDLAHVQELIRGKEGLEILDVGAWNGWLSNRLTQLGHQVTAVDFFTDPHDGLGAMKHYKATWDAIQMDLGDLSVLDRRFDLVVLNHGLHFFPDPVAHVAACQEKVRPGGRLIVLGLRFYRNPRSRIKEMAALQQTFRDRYGAEIFLRSGFITCFVARSSERASSKDRGRKGPEAAW